MTRTPWISLLALSLVASLGAAGASAENTEDRDAAVGEGALEIVDASLDPMPPAAAAYADIVGGRLELVEGDTLRATLELAALPEVTPGMAYVFVFRAGSSEHYIALASAPDTIYVYGDWADGSPGTMLDGAGSYTTGAGATITMDMPLSAAPGATVLTQPLAYATDIKGAVLPIGLPVPIGFVVLDEAEGEGELVVRESETEAAGGPAASDDSLAPAAAAADAAPAGAAPQEEPQPNNAIPTPTAFLVIAALALVALARRR